MTQMIVECNEPGWITLPEELENILSHITFERACEIAGQLAELATGMGSDYEQTWKGFRIEVPNECGAHPLSFGNREEADQKGIGRFDLWWTNLMDQSGAASRTRELSDVLTY